MQFIMRNELSIAKDARKLILQKNNIVGGSHIGGAFSIIDFLVSFYFNKYKFLKKSEFKNFYLGKSSNIDFELIFSKGHCYIAQLAVLDSIFSDTYYLDQYFAIGKNFFGHPKRIVDNNHFPVSTGSLGQGITFANGLALGNKFNKIENKIYVIVGDGEFNEGSCSEAIIFAAHHSLNITYIIDNNNQMSLNYTSNIFNNGNIKERFSTLNLKCQEIDGHNHSELYEVINNLGYGVNLIILNTIKGKGISFMEKDFKWHHRRFKGSEFSDAMEELNEK